MVCRNDWFIERETLSSKPFVLGLGPEALVSFKPQVTAIDRQSFCDGLEMSHLACADLGDFAFYSGHNKTWCYAADECELLAMK